MREIAGTRTHGTTGQKPLEVFEKEERAVLRALPPWPYERVVWKQAKVHSDSHVEFQGGLYSVPWTLIGQTVWVQATPSSVTVHADDARVATHERRRPGKRSTVDAHLPDHLPPASHRVVPLNCNAVGPTRIVNAIAFRVVRRFTAAFIWNPTGWATGWGSCGGSRGSWIAGRRRARDAARKAVRNGTPAVRRCADG